MILRSATEDQLAALRAQLVAGSSTSVEAFAQEFAGAIFTSFSSIVLSRVFVVAPYSTLPEDERTLLEDRHSSTVLSDTTPVLALLGTAGRRAAWNDRKQSRDHRATPLFDAERIARMPMIARLIQQLGIELAPGWAEGPLQTRDVADTRDRLFFIDDAHTARDERGRPIIDPEFAAQERVVSVFGLGGAYLYGGWIISMVFTTEMLTRAVVERYASLISTFKIVTLKLPTRVPVWSRDYGRIR